MYKLTNSDIYSLKSLWKKIFNDSDNYINLFFNSKFSLDKTYVIKKNNDITSALYYFDVYISDNIKTHKLAYLCGISTLYEYRGQGQASELISKCINDLKTKQYDGVFLIPASPSLFDFYKKFGFEIFSYLKTSEYEITPSKSEYKPLELNISDFYNKIDLAKVSRSENDYYILKKCYGEPFVFEDGYFFAHQEKNTLNIIEHNYLTKEKLIENASIAANSNIDKLIIKSPICADFGNTVPFTVYIDFNDITFYKDKYINLLLN